MTSVRSEKATATLFTESGAVVGPWHEDEGERADERRGGHEAQNHASVTARRASTMMAAPAKKLRA